MADPSRRLSSNAAGNVYVDDSCIDCGTCRTIAPRHFDAAGGYSRVHAQPAAPAEEHRALMALVACPTSSIGTDAPEPAMVRAARDAFPEEMTAGVFRLGFTSESSFGAMSYLVVRDGGNVLVDSPRFSRPLAAAIERLGGARWMFLTHRDDVADHARWAKQLGCERVMHGADVAPETRDVERVLHGPERVTLDAGLVVIPTPGHTRGSACLLHDDRVLFTGDHLAWRPGEQRLIAFRNACWFSWAEQTASMERLLGGRFTWVLPGHGHPIELAPTEMQRQLEACVSWMRSA